MESLGKPRNAIERALGRRVGSDMMGGLGSRHARSGGSAGRYTFTLE